MTNSSVLSDFYIAKYDLNGTVLWAKSSGGSLNDYGTAISLDATGVYVVGSFLSSSISFGAVALTNAGSSDLFVVKYNSSGNVIWAKKGGGNSAEYATSVASDPTGIYVTGSFSSASVTFGSTTLNNSGASNIYIVKYTTNGNVIWAKKEGGYSYLRSNYIYTYSSSVYLTGYFGDSTIVFGSTTLLNSNPMYPDTFVAKYDANGNNIWAKSAHGDASDDGTSLCVSSSGVYVTGNFDYSMYFDSTFLNSVFNAPYLIYLAKLSYSTGIDELGVSSSLTNVSPNPFTSQTTLTFYKEGKYTIKITDVLGKEIKTITFSGKEYILERGEMEKGIYFLQIMDENKNVRNKKIVVQ